MRAKVVIVLSVIVLLIIIGFASYEKPKVVKNHSHKETVITEKE
ncbi:hypothetical protein [Gracilibacillus dipsosauri]|nr:hypothetical protein [Gracilibacillus dipsosauri]